VDGHRKPSAGAAADDLLELLAARDLDTATVQEESGARAERAVQEDLDVADSQEVVAEARGDPDLLEPVEVLVGQRLPDAQRERLPA
jgi:hypothetical protein